jgi:hypothetical protein
MKIPNFSFGALTDRNGIATDDSYYFFQQLTSELQKNAGNEGLVVPTLSSENTSVTPPAAGGQITQIQADAENGTLIYDSFTNKLKVRLNDGTFHVIVTL